MNNAISFRQKENIIIKKQEDIQAKAENAETKNVEKSVKTEKAEKSDSFEKTEKAKNRNPLNPYNDHSSLLYSKQGYNNLLKCCQFIIGTLGTFAILQTIDNNMLKNKGKTMFSKLAKTCKLGIALAGGIGTLFAAKYTDKHAKQAAETLTLPHAYSLEFRNTPKNENK